MMGNWGYAYGAGIDAGFGIWGFFGMLICILFVIFLILGITYFWRELNKSSRSR